MIIDQITTTQDDMRNLKEEVNQRFDRLERLMVGAKELGRRSRSPKDDPETKPSVRQLDSPSLQTASNQSNAPPPSQTSPEKREHRVVDASPSGSSFHTSYTDNSGNDPFPAVAKQNAIAVEHNTAAQKLFRWPSIKKLLEKSRLKESEIDENFVMTYEANKGPLRLYGRGQGQDPAESASRMTFGSSSPATSAASIPSDDTSEGRSPASTPENVWGYGINPYVGEPRPENTMGGLHPNNTLKVDPKTIDTLLQNYLRHMHILHPFIDEQYLTNLMNKFKRRYNPGEMVGGHPNVDALRGADVSSGFSVPAKRKASEGQFWAVGNEHPPAATTTTTTTSKNDHPLLERSPATAMVLLVLALGKFCEHREPLPGPVPTIPRESALHPGRSGSPQGAYGQSPPESTPMRHSPSSSGQSMVNASAPSPIGLLRQNHRSPRSSAADLLAQNRNLDVIPGLAYYAQATDILGNLNGSTSLIYIQCCILAGLCAGQLANSLESLSWIQNGARALCILLNQAE